MSYRPRGTLARTLYDKIHNDQYLEGYDMRLVRILSVSIFYPKHYLRVSNSLIFSEQKLTFSVVYFIKNTARKIPNEIFSAGKTRRSDSTLVRSCQRIVR